MHSLLRGKKKEEERRKERELITQNIEIVPCTTISDLKRTLTNIRRKGERDKGREWEILYSIC